MARQECSNTFSDGLMMDLNPINTPKSVLTDCLNGTYITYNGNEFVLQNDMGNYKLKNCKLPTNFIPVGVKGYGDILYIVSYNPITNETEIGSYPAPQSIFTTGDSEELLAQENDLAPFVIEKNENGKTEAEYPTIIRTNKKPIFIFAGTDEDTYKLNPGDEFKFSGKLTPPTFIYQHLNFYIIDEDNKLYDIDDTQIYNENGSLVSNNTMRKVFWETPGWLAAQYDLYVPDKFNLNLRSLNVPEFLVAQPDNGTSSQAEEEKPLDEQIPSDTQFKVSMDLSSQTIITDKLFQTELNKNFGHNTENDPWEKNPANVYDHLYIRYLIKRNINPPVEGEDDYGTFKGIVVSLDDGTTKDYTNGVIEGDCIYYDIPVWKHNYQDDIITAYNNIRPIWFCNNPDKNQETGDLDIANYHGVVELTAYPIIKYNKLTLKYTQFSTTQRFPLNTLKNSSDITIADSIYKWSVDDDSCTVSFNINGPFINASDITGRYEIYRINLFNWHEPISLGIGGDWQGKLNELQGSPSLENYTEPKSVSTFGEEVNTDVYGVNAREFVKTKDERGNIKNYTLHSSTNKKVEIPFIKKDNEDTDFINVNTFQNSYPLLMCEGNLSNLVLYGQNTLNINWDLSNKYVLTNYHNYYTNPDWDGTPDSDGTLISKQIIIEDTSYIDYASKTKTIDFSKEGGIYIFRVILEQNGSQLAESQQVLIPSEVFNEWFGSIDNYNNIYENQWIEKYKAFLTISAIELYNANVNIYKSKSNREYNEIVKLNDKFLPIDYNKYVDEFKTFSDISSFNHLSKSIYSQSWPLHIDYLKLIESIDINSSISSKTLKGNLWNSNINFIYILKQAGKEICQLINTLDNKYSCISYLDQEDQKLLYQSNQIKIKEVTSQQLFPTTSIWNYVSISSDLVATNFTDDRNKHFSQWNYRNLLTTSETPLGGGVWTEKDGVTWPNSPYFRDPLACFGTKYNINVARFRIKHLSHVDKGWSCALCYGDGGAWLNTNRIISYGELSSDNWYDNNNSRFLVFRAANKAINTDYNGICIVDFGTNYDQHAAVVDILSKLYLNTYGDVIDAYAIKISNTINLNNKDSYHINKLDLRTTINLLKVDDVFLSYKTKLFNLDLNKINSNLIKVYLNDFNNILEQYNLSINSLLLEFNWINNEDYNDVYLYFNSQIEKYNKETTKQIDSSSTELQPITLKGDDPSGISQSVINKLTGQNGEKITINNVAWDNGTVQYLIMYNSRDGHSGTNPTNHTGKTFEAFIEEFTTNVT